jgi:tRNA threonylcarbamoyladenosine biosynthesis protein TsaB
MRMGPKTILIESSGRPGWVALAEGPVLLEARRLDEARRHARDLAPALAELLTRQGWRPGDVNAIAVGLGPGGYTGLRVGVMTAKAFAYATGCRVLGVDTFAALAAQVPAEAGAVEILADAQQGKVYHRRYRRAEVGMRAETPLAVSPAAEWHAGRDPAAWVTGPGAAMAGADVKLVPAQWREPRPEGLLLEVGPRLMRGESDDLFALAPVYLRASSAEENWRKRQSAGEITGGSGAG